MSAGLSNHGIIGKTDREPKVIDKNTITVDMFGNAFYRDTEYKMVTHARVFALSPKFEKFSRRILVTSVIDGRGNCGQL